MELISLADLGNSLRLMAIPVFLTFVGIVVLFADLVFDREDEQQWPAYLTIAGLVGALLLWVQNWLLFSPVEGDGPVAAQLRQWLNIQPIAQPGMLFSNAFDPVGIGGLTLSVTFLVIVVALVATLLAPRYLERRGIQRGEFYALMLFATVGLILMAGGTHLIIVFLGLELLSIPLYILAGFARPDLSSEEAGLKYFLLGAFASGFLLYGIALIFGATGSMNLREIPQILYNDLQSASSAIVFPDGTINLMLVASFILLMVGVSFKISLVPFHQWTPDVYEGAPTPVTAFMVAATKAGGFAMLVNIIIAFLPLDSQWWMPLLVTLSILTMLGGNIGALLQTNIKRMLAYSSIAHAGYMLVGIIGVVGEANAYGNLIISFPALILYLFVYALMNLGAFAVVIALEQSEGEEIVELSQFRGLGRNNMGLGLLLTFFLLSLAGFPPTAGFFAKFFLFSGAVFSGQLWLVAIAVVLSIISVYYYIRYVVAMFMQRPESEEVEERVIIRREPVAPAEVPDEEVVVVEEGAPQPRPATSWMVRTALIVTAVLVLGIGLFPNPILNLFTP